MDSPEAGHSILDIESILYDQGKVTRVPYLEDWPFPYYIILRDIDNLPQTLADALRQWFEMVQNSDMES